ncbi:MAG: PTS sugar transporter subunit IIA [Polyangiaceae bacterium]|nr:PTS sugar transporter subunit IIA [Polyangiaceae bacterium]
MPRLTDFLTPARIQIHAGPGPVSRDAVLDSLAELLAGVSHSTPGELSRSMREREALQSTGIGGGVAVPHCFVDAAPAQHAALVLFPRGVEFGALDGGLVHIAVGVVGPRRPTDHLRVLARVSRLLHAEEMRAELLRAEAPEQVMELLRVRDEGVG